MNARVLLAVIGIASIVMAGCSQSSDSGTPAPTTSVPPATADGWILDCTLGSYEQAIDATWGQRCVARGSHTLGSKTETWTSVNPVDPNNVVVGSKDLNPESSPGCVWNGLAVTHDGGKTWKDVVIGGTFTARAPTSPFFGYYCNTDPDFRFDSKGDLHYGVEMYGLCPTGMANEVCAANAHASFTAGWKILLATSHDGGDTFPDVVVYQPDFIVTTDFSRMARSQTTDTVIEAIGAEGGVACNVLRWSPASPQVATVEPVATKDGIPCDSGGGAGVAASPDGTFVLVGAARVVVRSTDDGVTFTDSNALFSWNGIPGQWAESGYRVTNTLESAYDVSNGPGRGTLYVCYAAQEREGDQADIYVRSSTDDGRTWSEPAIVNDDESGNHQWMCNLGVASDGSVHVFWMDKRWDPDHKLIDIAHGVSVDGGKTFRNERVTTKSFDGDLGIHQDGGPFIGDYLGVDCAGLDCWVGFPDSHQGDVPVIAAAHVYKA